MCDIGRIDCERETTRKDGSCEPCARYYARGFKKMMADEAERRIEAELADIRADLALAGLA